MVKCFGDPSATSKKSAPAKSNHLVVVPSQATRDRATKKKKRRNDDTREAMKQIL